MHKKRDIQIIVSASNRKLMLSLIDFSIFTPILLFKNSEIQNSFEVGELYKWEEFICTIMDSCKKGHVKFMTENSYPRFSDICNRQSKNESKKYGTINVEIFMNFLRDLSMNREIH